MFELLKDETLRLVKDHNTNKFKPQKTGFTIGFSYFEEMAA